MKWLDSATKQKAVYVSGVSEESTQEPTVCSWQLLQYTCIQCHLIAHVAELNLVTHYLLIMYILEYFSVLSLCKNIAGLSNCLIFFLVLLVVSIGSLSTLWCSASVQLKCLTLDEVRCCHGAE